MKLVAGAVKGRGEADESCCALASCTVPTAPHLTRCTTRHYHDSLASRNLPARKLPVSPIICDVPFSASSYCYKSPNGLVSIGVLQTMISAWVIPGAAFRKVIPTLAFALRSPAM